MPTKRLTIALAGNPNSGKTTVFNNLTGTRQKVGNWPGVTVEKKEGHVRFNGLDLTIVDLPGTYSLTPFSIEEVVARNYLLDERPDVVSTSSTPPTSNAASILPPRSVSSTARCSSS
jgi:ferrous iron transport protein B